MLSSLVTTSTMVWSVPITKVARLFGGAAAGHAEGVNRGAIGIGQQRVAQAVLVVELRLLSTASALMPMRWAPDRLELAGDVAEVAGPRRCTRRS